eukprot:scaffold1771_cov121-Isochrysis_galbana.AAC.2
MRAAGPQPLRTCRRPDEHMLAQHYAGRIACAHAPNRCTHPEPLALLVVLRQQLVFVDPAIRARQVEAHARFEHRRRRCYSTADGSASDGAAADGATAASSTTTSSGGGTIIDHEQFTAPNREMPNLDPVRLSIWITAGTLKGPIPKACNLISSPILIRFKP